MLSLFVLLRLSVEVTKKLDPPGPNGPLAWTGDLEVCPMGPREIPPC